MASEQEQHTNEPEGGQTAPPRKRRIALAIVAVVVVAIVAFVAVNAGSCGSQAVPADSASGSAGEAVPDDAPAARVGETIITEGEVRAQTERFRANAGLAENGAWQGWLAAQGLDEAAYRSQTVERLVHVAVVDEAARQLGVSVADRELDQRMAQLQRAFAESLPENAYVASSADQVDSEAVVDAFGGMLNAARTLWEDSAAAADSEGRAASSAESADGTDDAESSESADNADGAEAEASSAEDASDEEDWARAERSRELWLGSLALNGFDEESFTEYIRTLMLEQLIALRTDGRPLDDWLADFYETLDIEIA